MSVAAVTMVFCVAESNGRMSRIKEGEITRLQGSEEILVDSLRVARDR